MPDLIRPEARVALRKWAEALVSVAVIVLGLYWSLTALGPVRWGGWLVAAFGLALLFSALQRVRFAAKGEGPGMVQVIEGEIRYFGPRGGGFVAVDAITVLSLSADGQFWLIEAEDGQVLVLPRAAAGAEGLFDAFVSLPGLEMAQLLRLLAQDPAPRARVIWQRRARPLLT